MKLDSFRQTYKKVIEESWWNTGEVQLIPLNDKLWIEVLDNGKWINVYTKDYGQIGYWKGGLLDIDHIDIKKPINIKNLQALALWWDEIGYKYF